MAGCKDIIVNIQDFNSADTYIVTIRLKGSVVTDANLLPTYTITATGPQVIFKNLPDGLYEVQITRKCSTGGTSISGWQDTIAVSCESPVNPFIDTITGTTAKANWTGVTGETYEYSLNGSDWAPTTNYAYHDITGLVAGEVYTIRIRKKCGAFLYSLPVRLNFTATTATPEFNVALLAKLCKGNEFIGYHLRFSFAGGLAAIGQTYRIRYTDFYGTVHTLVEREVIVGDTLAIVANDIANVFNPENFIVGSDFASFETISKEQKAENGMDMNCQEINDISGYATDIF